jgi:putative transposase
MAEQMAETSLRKTFKCKLKPTPEQEQKLERVLWACRSLYNTAIEQRQIAYERCSVSLSRYGQEAELKDLRAEMPEYAGIHSHVLQDVLARLDKAFQAFFRRIREGQTPGYSRFHGRDRYKSFTYKEFGNGARLDNGFLVLSKIGRIALRWSRPLEGGAQDRHDRTRGGWLVCRLLLRGHPCCPAAAYQPGDGHRPGLGVLRDARGRHDDPQPALLS